MQYGLLSKYAQVQSGFTHICGHVRFQALQSCCALQDGLQGPIDIVGTYKSQGIDVALEVVCSQQALEGSGRLGEDLPGETFLRKSSASESPIVYVGGHQVGAAMRMENLVFNSSY